MRCDNQHFVPTGYTYCRRCEGAGGVAVATRAPAPPIAAPTPLVSVGVFVNRRNRLVAIDFGVLVACALLAVGAVVNALVVGLFMTAAVAIVLGITTEAPTEVHPVSALQLRSLDRLKLLPVVAVLVTLAIVLL